MSKWEPIMSKWEIFIPTRNYITNISLWTRPCVSRGFLCVTRKFVLVSYKFPLYYIRQLLKPKRTTFFNKIYSISEFYAILIILSFLFRLILCIFVVIKYWWISFLQKNYNTKTSEKIFRVIIRPFHVIFNLK